MSFGITIRDFPRVAYQTILLQNTIKVIIMKMSDYYYVNRHPDFQGNHGIHAGRCSKLPVVMHRNVLGLYDNPQLPVVEARRRGYKRTIVCPCRYCLNP